MNHHHYAMKTKCCCIYSIDGLNRLTKIFKVLRDRVESSRTAVHCLPLPQNWPRPGASSTSCSTQVSQRILVCDQLQALASPHLQKPCVCT